MSSRQKLYRRYGKLVDGIQKLLPNSSKQEIKAALKRAKDIESLTKLKDAELYWFMVDIESHFMSEYGIELLPDNLELKEIFKKVNLDYGQQ